jgi:hypothetical protein
VSDVLMWVATECNCHDLLIFLVMFGSGTTSHPCASGEGPPQLVAKLHCLHPAVKQGNAAAYQGTCDL